MDKMKRYLEKNGLFYTVHSYGANYFSDHSLDIHFSGICLGFYTNTPGEIPFLRNIEKCGYKVIFSGGFPGFHFYHIAPAADVERLEFYNSFKNESVKACEKEMHFSYEYFGRGGDPGLNERLAGIMEFYEMEYKKALAGGVAI